jgi:Zinc carboxypeptidase
MSQVPDVIKEWQTYAEKTGFRETPRYAETIEYSRRLDEASTLVQFASFGKSGEGRELPLLIVAEGGTFDPDKARRAGKAVVMIQACIHAGESDGKDAGLALIRDIAIRKTQPGLLKNVVVLFIPIYNVDGHERFEPYNRINQNGPAEMGWRATTTNLNLNRDYMKADAPETRAWLALWNSWKPDLFIDCHVTDGADYQYNITYQYEHFSNVAPSVVAWERSAFDGRIAPAAEAAGNLVSSYMEFRDNRDLMKGINSFIGPPRFSTGYVPIRNRPGLLIETHMLKDYRSRVKGTYDMLKAALDEVNRDPESLKNAGREADREVVEGWAKYDPSRKYPLQFELTESSVPRKLKGVEYHTELSPVSGAVKVVFGSKPIELTVPLYDEAKSTVAISPPLYYIVPPQWTAIIEVLKAHGVKLRRLKSDASFDVESYRFSDVKFASTSFEGRVMPSFRSTMVREKRIFPAGSVVVPLNQEEARVAMYLLEPDSPDSFVAWGFFNPIFEQKEYAESYVLEKLAKEMMDSDPALKREFEGKVANDPKFAASSRARLNFFFERSPYWDHYLNLYPVGRVTAPITLELFD